MRSRCRSKSLERGSEPTCRQTPAETGPVAQDGAGRGLMLYGIDLHQEHLLLTESKCNLLARDTSSEASLGSFIDARLPSPECLKGLGAKEFRVLGDLGSSGVSTASPNFPSKHKEWKRPETSVALHCLPFRDGGHWRRQLCFCAAAAGFAEAKVAQNCARAKPLGSDQGQGAGSTAPTCGSTSHFGLSFTQLGMGAFKLSIWLLSASITRFCSCGAMQNLARIAETLRCSKAFTVATSQEKP